MTACCNLVEYMRASLVGVTVELGQDREKSYCIFRLSAGWQAG